MIRKLNNTAFTLLEILLASVIFIISVAGVFVTLNAIRKPVADKESSLTAAVFGKQVLEALRSQVNTSSYYANCTIVNSACPDFSLYLGLHQVNSTTLSNEAGLSWPTGSLSSANGGILTYTVYCGDGSNPTSTTPPDCQNALGNDIARKVVLSINWTSAS